MKQKKEMTRKKPMARSTSTLQQKKPLATAKPPNGPKPKKCANRACRAPYQPNARHPFMTWCSPECGAVVALEKIAKQKAARAKAERAADKVKREKLKRRADWLREAQAAFNAFIRERDKDRPCICCGRTSEKEYLTGSNWDCGHYRSTGSAPHMRFTEDNAHRQLTVCNRHGGGRAVDYRIGLIGRIGIERVEAIESDNTVRKWSVDELIAIKKHYQDKLKQLRAGAAPRP